MDIKQSKEEQAHSEQSNVFGDYLKAVNNEKKVIPNYQLKWNFLIQQQVFNEVLPAYIKGELSCDELIDAFDDGVNQYNEKGGIKE